MLGVSFQSEGEHFDERDAAAGTCAVDGAPRRIVDGQDVVAVDGLALASDADALVRQGLCRGLVRGRGGVRVGVVLHDDHHRQALHGGEVEPFPERAGGRAAVADEGQGDQTLLLHPSGQGDAGHDRDHVPQHRDLPDEAVVRGVAEVNVQLAPAGRRVALGHVLPDDVDGLRAGHENRAEVADERLHDVALFVIERVRRGDGLTFLSQ